MKKKLATTLLAGAMSVSMVIPTFATTPTSPAGTGEVVTADTGTEVWAGIIIQDKNPVVKVEVPTLFAFVVNGTTDSNDASAVTSTNGNIYLPNVKVDVTTASSGGTGGVYGLTYTGDGIMRMNNYSTYEEKDTASGVTVRKGLELKINGEIREASSVASANKFWVYSAAAAPTIARGDFKKYQISIDNIGLTTGTTTGYKMASDISLAAPDTQFAVDTSGTTPTVTYANLDDATKLAANPTTHTANFDVIVGGERGQYNQVEQSAKIGTIVWTVSADATVAGTSTNPINTAPDNDYLAIDPTSANNDTTPTAP